MTPIEIVTIVLSITIVVSVVVGVIINKLRGKPSCCSDCKGCPYHTQCAKQNSACQMAKDASDGYYQDVIGNEKNDKNDN